jgi:hypothetical protein
MALRGWPGGSSFRGSPTGWSSASNDGLGAATSDSLSLAFSWLIRVLFQMRKIWAQPDTVVAIRIKPLQIDFHRSCDHRNGF